MHYHSGRLSNLMTMPLSLLIILKWNLSFIGSKAYKTFSNICLRLLNEEIFQKLCSDRKASKSKLVLTCTLTATKLLKFKIIENTEILSVAKLKNKTFKKLKNNQAQTYQPPPNFNHKLHAYYYISYMLVCI